MWTKNTSWKQTDAEDERKMEMKREKKHDGEIHAFQK